MRLRRTTNVGGLPPTPSQTVGPFYGFALPFPGDSDAAPDGELRLEGRVLDGAGEPVADALLELWEGDQFGRCRTDLEGAYHFTAREATGSFFNLTLHGRGILKPLYTRIYISGAREENDAALALVEATRRATLFAVADGPILRFDVRLQGEGETVFFAP